MPIFENKSGIVKMLDFLRKMRFRVSKINKLRNNRNCCRKSKKLGFVYKKLYRI